MMKVGIIDADLIGRKRHRFPNLVCMKLSGYHKARGDTVSLKTNYDGLADFDRVYIAKVFTDTAIPGGGLFGEILSQPNVEYGGTGFYYDNAPPLPYEVEHHMPDYHLYDGWAGEGKEFKAYRDYSIGYLTRGCFRHCPFCVNRRSSRVVRHSPLSEFVDHARRKICLLDDNFFGYEGWRELLTELISTGKPFRFKQGLDIRLVDEERAAMLFSARYDGDYIFAFDDYKDAALIEDKIRLIGQYVRLSNNRVKLYTLCGYDRRGVYDESFWQKDLRELVLRMAILRKHNCLPYVMRYERYKDSPYRQVYIDLAAYGNQPRLFRKMPLTEFCRKHRRHIGHPELIMELQDLMEAV